MKITHLCKGTEVCERVEFCQRLMADDSEQEEQKRDEDSRVGGGIWRSGGQEDLECLINNGNSKGSH